MFDPSFSGQFKLFTVSHILAIIAIAAACIVIPLVFKTKKLKKYDLIFRVLLATLLVAQYLGWVLWEVLCGRFSTTLSLPLNLCDFTNFLCAFLLISRSYQLYEVVYFWSIAGAIQSIITPNISFAFPHLEFWIFFIQHGGEVLAVFYITVVTGYRPKAISMVKSFGLLALFILLVYLFNLALNANYMFLMADTPQPSTVTQMIALFGEPPRHILGLGLVAVVSIVVLYVPFYFCEIFKKTQLKTEKK